MDVDHEVALAQMGPLLAELTSQTAPPPPPIPEELLIEARYIETAVDRDDWTGVPGMRTEFLCPECGGPLREVGPEPVRRYRCRVGHGYTAPTLLSEQDRAIEEALWSALRSLQERTRMLDTMARDDRQRGLDRSATLHDERAVEALARIEGVRELLRRSQRTG
jgi:two-component system chemotaxis response regulator CheB